MRTRSIDDVSLISGGLALIAGAVLWFGGACALLVSGHGFPHGEPLAGVLALAHLDDPSAAWVGGHVGVGTYWSVCGAVVALLIGAGVAGWHQASRHGFAVACRSDGLASPSQVRSAAGAGSLRRRGSALRPSLTHPSNTELGYRLGRARGVECWASVEDSIVVLGPPRSGKGLHLVIPAIRDAPGAVVTTSTRADNIAATMAARTSIGPVAVFDPQGMLATRTSSTRWSPIRGCEIPRIAMARARALIAEPAAGVEHGSFWTQQCHIAVRCLLHAAALAHRPPVELYRWSLSPLAAEDAADVLRTHPHAAPAWGAALETILAADPRQRDSTWAMVSNTFAALADPAVLDAVSPVEGQEFDPPAFLQKRGTLYLLGTATGASATASLVSALVEDVVESARRLAAGSPGVRLDPPVALILDEAANYPLPSLPSLMSDGGGTGITTMVVLQSLAQARARWGRDEAAAVWDAAIVKLILGGSGSADDLRDLSALIGTRQERRLNESWGDGRRSTTTSTHEVPILEVGRLRTLPFGEAMLLLRSAPPIRLTMKPWTRPGGTRRRTA